MEAKIDPINLLHQIRSHGGTPASVAFNQLLHATLNDLHYRMESAAGDELLILQGQARLMRQWLNKTER